MEPIDVLFGREPVSKEVNGKIVKLEETMKRFTGIKPIVVYAGEWREGSNIPLIQSIANNGLDILRHTHSYLRGRKMQGTETFTLKNGDTLVLGYFL